MAEAIDRILFDKAIDMTATALRGAMGGENSQPPGYAAEVFKEIWAALREAAKDLPDKPATGF